MALDHKTFNIPNLISLIRICMAPLLIYFAMNQMEIWFLSALIFSGLTDVLDGFLARRLKQITTLGSHLDSWGDFTIFTTMAVGAWILWPQIVQREIIYFAIIVGSFSLPVAVGLIKFKRVTSYHTWSVKLAVPITYLGYILLFAEITQWPFILASLICVYAGIEEILITLVMRHERVDVRSIWAAIKYEHPADN
jgi:cardiolipin synthase